MVGSWGLIGFVIGIIGTLFLSVGNMVIRKCKKKESLMNSPIKRFL